MSEPREFNWFVPREPEGDPVLVRAAIIIRNWTIQSQLRSSPDFKYRFGKSNETLKKDMEANQARCAKIGHEPATPTPPNPKDKSGTGGIALVHCSFCGALLPDQC